MVVIVDVPEVGGLGLMQYDEDVTMGKYEAGAWCRERTTKLESVSLWARMEIRKRAAVEFSAKQGRIELRRQAGVRAAAWVSKRLCRKRS